ncbi:MAG: histidine kinase dimerization/phospho-acceptor domain-containing protein [Kiritimatiellales bacterium]|nr:histidine kinase dimerization/phospho-acceptor domain-containing protein [Kiritimatiellales bacterium]
MKKIRHEEEERTVSWITMMGLLGGRLATISGFLIVLSFVLRQDSIAFYAFIAFAYIITIPYSLWMRNQDRMRQLAPLQFLVDLVFVSGLVYFAGGLQNDFLILLYPLIILSAGIILPLKQTIQITVLAIISYTLVILLISQNILIRYPAKVATQELIDTSGAMALRIIIFIFFGIASAYVSRRCDYISKKEKQFREITKIIFKNVKTGLLLLDANDRILMANDRACVLLSRDESELTGKSLSSIHLKPSDLKNGDTDLRGASDYFRRADGSVFPVSIEDERITLPSEAVPHEGAKAGGLVDTRILNFNDLSHFLRLQGQTRQLERIKAAANMAKEMAHQIRTPLTGISGAVQLLQINLKSNDEAAAAKEREELCHQIVMESIRMDKVIQNFLDYAEFSPKDIRDLIQMDIDQGMKSR